MLPVHTAHIFEFSKKLYTEYVGMVEATILELEE